MIINQIPYPLSFSQEKGQTLIARYGEEGRQYVMQPDVDVSGLVASLQIVKPDNTFVIASADIVEPEEGPAYIVITIPLQATAVKGIGHYSLYIQDDADMIIYSAEGQIWVDDHLITDDMMESIAEVYGYRFPQDFFTVDMIPEIIPLVTAEILDDDNTSETTTWSSQKISDEIEQVAGATSLGDLSDVSITDPQDRNIIMYDNIDEIWKNAEIPGHVYSTQEHVAGKWIDGSDLYEITLDTTSPASINTNATIESLSTLSFDKIISVEGIIYAAGVSQYVPIFWSYNTSIIGTVYIDGTNLKQIVSSAAYCNCREWITIRYTKQ